MFQDQVHIIKLIKFKISRVAAKLTGSALPKEEISLKKNYLSYQGQETITMMKSLVKEGFQLVLKRMRSTMKTLDQEATISMTQ
jgi:thiazole synthase ThiGH ThiG subunit